MIQDALEKYPVRKNLANGIQCMIRPLEASDETAFHEFYMAVPEQERAFIKHRVTDGGLFHEWCSEIDYEQNLPMLAFADGKMIGDITLHQRSGGWKRHIGLVSVLTHPDFRNIGLADALIEEIVEVARHAGLTKLEAEFNGERVVAMKALGLCGFSELIRIPAYVQDMNANYHDYVLMGMDLHPPEELMGPGD